MDLGLKGKRPPMTGGGRSLGQPVAEGFAAEGEGRRRPCRCSSPTVLLADPESPTNPSRPIC